MFQYWNTVPVPVPRLLLQGVLRAYYCKGAGEKVGGLSADLIPDPKCGVDIRLSPTISQV